MQSWILYLLFFSLPFQIRLLLVAGINEYQSIFLYASDILIGLVFLFWLLQSWKSRFQSLPKPLLSPAVFLIAWFLLASLFSQNIPLGIWRTIKLLEFTWLFFYLISLSRTMYGSALKALIASGVFQSVIAIGQFIAQRDLGLRILGENILAPDIAGVAKIEIFGEKFIRAYGTFPHPNVLATFLLFCIFVLLFLYLKEKKHSIPYTLFRAKRETRFTQWFLFRAKRETRFCPKGRFLYPIPFLALAFLLTFSRVVIIVGILALALWFLLVKDRPWHLIGIFLLSLFIFTTILFPFFQERVSVSFDDQAVSLRLLYMKNALEAIREHPLLGVGPGQFTAFQEPIIQPLASQPWVNQPVHNIYLLLASETGLPALFFFLWFIIEVFRAQLRDRRHWKLEIGNWIFPIAFLAIGLFDHFFITFQQGALIFWTALALCSQLPKVDATRLRLSGYGEV